MTQRAYGHWSISRVLHKNTNVKLFIKYCEYRRIEKQVNFGQNQNSEHRICLDVYLGQIKWIELKFLSFLVSHHLKYHIYNIRCISVIMLAVILGNEPKYDKTK